MLARATFALSIPYELSLRNPGLGDLNNGFAGVDVNRRRGGSPSLVLIFLTLVSFHSQRKRSLDTEFTGTRSICGNTQRAAPHVGSAGYLYGARGCTLKFPDEIPRQRRHHLDWHSAASHLSKDSKSYFMARIDFELLPESLPAASLVNYVAGWEVAWEGLAAWTIKHNVFSVVRLAGPSFAASRYTVADRSTMF